MPDAGVLGDQTQIRLVDSAGFAVYLTKPVAFDALLEAIKAVSVVSTRATVASSPTL